MVAVVTGATGGIGRWIALGLALAGQRVVMVGRDRGRGEAARAWIAAQAPAAQTDLLISDLSSLAATREAGQLIADRFPHVDILINNAGVFMQRREATPEGHERVLATNHLSPFVLTQTLLPCLASSGRARIVNIGSSRSDKARIDPDGLELDQRWTMTRAYDQSKLAMMLTTFALAQQLQGTGVVANVVHPGLVATGIVRAGGAVGMAWRLLQAIALSPEQGADTPLFMALAPEMATVSGGYYCKRQPRRPNRATTDTEIVSRTWSATERLVERTLAVAGPAPRHG